MEDKKTNIYAGFWVRSIASLIDIIVLVQPFILIVMLFDIWSILHIESIFIFLVLWGIYSVIMLSSSWNATLGKKILGLKVLTKTLEPLDVKASIKRFIFAFITYILLLLPLLLSIRIFSFMTYSWTDIFFSPIFLPLLNVKIRKK
ncbi:MAG: RDD family protein [Sulfurovum sp.]|nr:RDD family protein [Sulfurovum sp.]